jgi:hypothetical protein
MKLNFDAINRSALQALPVLLDRWLPDGRKQGREYVARNPTRNDRRAGSFSINTVTGSWADFADDRAKGGDVVSLYAYLRNIGQGEAARELAAILRITS